MDTRKAFESGKAVLGIEFGSTRIKAVLIGEDQLPIASGSHEWENSYENSFWTYDLEDVWTGLKDCYQKLNSALVDKYQVSLQVVGAIGFSAMMHGYLAFNKSGNSAGSVSNVAKYLHRAGSRTTNRSFPIQYSPALEHCTSLPGDSER